MNTHKNTDVCEKTVLAQHHSLQVKCHACCQALHLPDVLRPPMSCRSWIASRSVHTIVDHSEVPPQCFSIDRVHQVRTTYARTGIGVCARTTLVQMPRGLHTFLVPRYHCHCDAYMYIYRLTSLPRAFGSPGLRFDTTCERARREEV